MGKGARWVARELIRGDSLHVADLSEVLPARTGSGDPSPAALVAQTPVSGLSLATWSAPPSYRRTMAR